MTPAELKAFRLKKGWTQDDLADNIRETRQSVSLMETGQRSITPKTELLLQYIGKYGLLKPAKKK